jgi:8-oxo-dGTP diphosphatase
VDVDEMEENVPHRPGKLYAFNHGLYSRMNKKAFGGIDF